MRGIPRHKRKKYAEEWRKADEHDMSFKEYAAVRARQEGAISRQEAINVLEHAGRTEQTKQLIAREVTSAGGAVIERVGSSPLKITDKATGSYATVSPSGKINYYANATNRDAIPQPRSDIPKPNLVPSDNLVTGTYGEATTYKRAGLLDSFLHPVKSARENILWLEDKARKAEFGRSKTQGKDTLSAVKYGGVAFAAGGVAATGRMIFHPVETVKGTAYAATHPKQTVETIGGNLVTNPASTLGELTVPAVATFGFGKGAGKALRVGELESVSANVKAAEVGEVSRFKVGDKAVDVTSFDLGVKVTSRPALSKGVKTVSVMGKEVNIPYPKLFSKKTTSYAGAGRELAVTEKLNIEGTPSKYDLSVGMGDVTLGKLGGKETVTGASGFKALSRPFKTDTLIGTGAKWQTSFKIGEKIKSRGGTSRSITTKDPFMSIAEGGSEFGTHPIMGETKLGWTETINKGRVKTKVIPEKQLDVYASATKKQAEIGLDNSMISGKEIWKYQTQRAGGKTFLQGFEKEWQGLKNPTSRTQYPQTDLTLPKPAEMIKQQKGLSQRIKGLEDVKPSKAKPEESFTGVDKPRPILEQKAPPSLGLSRSTSKQLASDIAVTLEQESIKSRPIKSTPFTSVKLSPVSAANIFTEKSVIQGEGKTFFTGTGVGMAATSFMIPKIKTLPKSKTTERFLSDQMSGLKQVQAPKTIQTPKTTQIPKIIQIPAVKTIQQPKIAQQPKTTQLFNRPSLRPVPLRPPLPPITPPPPPPVTPSFKSFRFLGGGKKKKKSVLGKSSYIFSVEASLFNVKGGKPSKTSASSGLTIRPIIEKKKTRRKKR